MATAPGASTPGPPGLRASSRELPQRLPLGPGQASGPRSTLCFECEGSPSHRSTDAVSITFAEYAGHVERIAGGLAALGVGRGDTVGIMLTNRPEFHLVDTGVLHAGATPFSIYNSSSPEQVEYLASHGEAKVAIVEDEGFLERRDGYEIVAFRLA